MKNVLGDNLTLTLFGESHSDYIGATLDGLTPGIKIDDSVIKHYLSLRRPCSCMDTARVEEDEYKIISGEFNGYTTGAPLTIIIPNKNVNSNAYTDLENKARPSHADYAAYMKYHGFADYRGGGHFSGRITAPIVALGAICIDALNKKGIKIATHIYKCGNVIDKEFEKEEELDLVNNKKIPLINNLEENLEKEILKAKENKDSIGGIIETAIYNMPAGVGDPWFSSIEGKLSNSVFSIGGVKGIEFGLGFGFGEKMGSEANDEFIINNGSIKTKTNNNGGINGGITNGMPITFKCAIKPTPSIGLKQNTVDFKNNKEVELEIKGRHDPAIIRRICVVITAISAITICDLLITRYGEDYLK
ncbi:MAG: chorismate synthase [bacterium]|nr:chorismate synthase [bacterium]